MLAARWAGFLHARADRRSLGGVVVGGGIALLVVALRGLPAKPAHEKQRPANASRELIRFASRRGCRSPSSPGWWSCCSPAGSCAGSPPACSSSSGTGCSAAPSEERVGDRRGSRGSPPGPSRCATPSPARSASSRRSRPPPRAAAPAIRPQLDALVDRLRVAYAAARRRSSSSPTTSTTPRADLIVAALMLNSRLRGPGLRDVLSALADSAREELDMRRRVKAQRGQHPAQRADRRSASRSRSCSA